MTSDQLTLPSGLFTERINDSNFIYFSGKVTAMIAVEADSRRVIDYRWKPDDHSTLHAYEAQPDGSVTMRCCPNEREDMLQLLSQMALNSSEDR